MERMSQEQTISASPEKLQSIATVAEDEVYVFPMSFAQRRMWFLYQMDSLSPAYNVPLALRLHGTLHKNVLERCLNVLLARHEVLRTTYDMLNNEPVQMIASAQTISLDYIDVRMLPESQREFEVQQQVRTESQRPFDLVRGPVLRATLFALSDQEHIFLLNFHHIAVDGLSLGVFYKELQTLYNAFLAGQPSPLPPLPIQYADFAEWQLKQLQGETYQKLIQYWRNRLAGELPQLRIPANPRPSAEHSAQGERQFFTHPSQLVERVKALCQQTGTTMFMTLLAAYQTLLHRCSGQDDIIIGSPIANRNRPELAGVIGFFANTLALRCTLANDPSFLTFLKQVQEVSLEAYTYQDLPFEQLVAELQPERSPDRNPIFQYVFALQRPLEPSGEMHGVQIETYEIQNDIVKFDLEFIIWEDHKGLQGCFVYNLDLFDHATITRLTRYWLTLLESIVDNPDERLSRLQLLPSQMRTALLALPPSSLSQPAHTTDLISLFESQVVRFPEKTALLAREQTWTYEQLARRVRHLAAYLQAMGIKQETPVALYVERSPQLVVGVLATLEAGGACVLLDPTSPPAYIDSILGDSGAALLLTQQHTYSRVAQAGYSLPILNIDDEQSWFHQADCSWIPVHLTPDALVSIHYAPGQGIMLEQRAVINHLHWLQQLCALTNEDVVLHTATPGQVWVLWEILWPLTLGACLVVPSSEELDDLQTFMRVLNERGITVAHLSTRSLQCFSQYVQDLDKDVPYLFDRVIYYGFGTSTERDMLANACQSLNASIFHLTTLPEVTTAINAQVYRPQQELNPQICQTPVHSLILDQHMQVMPEGIYGELCIASTHLARGYSHNPLANATRFVSYPFDQQASTDGMRLFRTGQKARLLENGQAEYCENEGRYIWWAERILLVENIEEALLRYSSIERCALDVRTTTEGERALVVSLVSRGPISLEDLRSYLHAILPAALVPNFSIHLSALPLTSQGRLDIAALQKQPALDDELLKRWQQVLQAVPGVEQVAVLVEEIPFRSSPLHVSDILPDWKRLLKSSTAIHKDELPASGKVLDETQLMPTKMAVSEGPELILAPYAPRTLPEALARASQESPAQKIIHVQADGTEVCQTYVQVREEAERISGGLRQLGLQPHDKVFFQFDLTQDFISAFWGCMLGGFIPVPLSVAPTYSQANSATSKLQHAWHVLRPALVLAGKALASPLRSMAEQAHLADFKVVSLDELRNADPDPNWYPSHPEDLALLLLTSGSTGVPKGVMLNHRNLLCRSAATAQMNKFSREDISLNWMPLDHVGGIVMYHLLATYLCSQQIHVSTQVILEDPLKWLDLIDRYHVTDTWAPNFAYNLVNKYAEEISQRRWDLSSLRFILNGGEAVVARTARRFLELLQPHGLPATAMHPAWGMSETSSGVTFSHSFTLDLTDDAQPFVEVGSPIPGVAIRIVDANNTVLPEGAVGQLQIKGLPVTCGYYQNPELNREIFTDDGWFTTGDLGKIIDGKLTITGRAKDVIIVNGVNIPYYDIEATVEEIEGVDVSFTAACAVREDDSDTDRLALFLVPTVREDQQRAALFKDIRLKVATTFGISVHYLVAVQREDIPKTAIGKIQRSLLVQRFLNGDLDAHLKEVDLLLRQRNVLPPWFYERIWIRKEASLSLAHLVADPILLFLDTTSLSQQLLEACRSVGLRYIRVEAGQDFIHPGPDRYQINPHVPDHYRRLLEEIEQPIKHILHCWTCNSPSVPDLTPEILHEQQYFGTYSILFLAQALAYHSKGEQSIRLFVVSRCSTPVNTTTHVNLSAAPLGGLLPTISLELPWLQCTHIDLDDTDEIHNIQRVLSELISWNEDREIAYRQGQRFAPSLKPVDVVRQPVQPLPFQQGGVYLITGGLGGIGSLLAAYLLQHFQARLILIGKTRLPDQQEWPDLLKKETPLAPYLKRYQTLQALKHEGDWYYESVDVSDLASLQDLVERAEARWQQPLAGVLHLAGEGNLAAHWQVIDQHMVINEQVETFENMFRAKVYGTWALYQLLKMRPQSWFLAFSSIHALFGGSSFSAYSAANSFLDAYTQYQRQFAHPQTYSLSWSIWENIGLSQDNPAYSNEIASNLGYHTISKEQGLISFLVALTRSPHSWIIGLDQDNHHIQRALRSPARPVQRFHAYITTSPPDLHLSGLPGELPDRFGTPSSCLIQRVSELPLTPAGEIDYKQLQQYMRTQDAASSEKQAVLPSTELECTIASIWCEVLNIDHIAIDDNFFSLGGHSLHVSQVHSKLQALLPYPISIVDLLKYQTIRALTEYLLRQENAAASERSTLTESQERAKRRKDLQRQKMQKRLQKDER
jgi:non-ribosomal peptide synthetase component F/NAD(P)-dependent dehydrogenase (short-subunit alcohol dehydrogenase family)/acyl carrier protein